MARWHAEQPDPERLQQRTVRVLVAAQVLGGAAIGVGAAVSPLLAKEILGADDTFAGVAFAALTFGSALAAVPLSRLMSQRGRRPGLVCGYLTAMTGAAAVVAAEVESFPLLLAGMVLIGSGTAANLLSRYAGADLAAPDHRARAISTVVWATTIGAVAGPNALALAGRVGDWLGLPTLAGPFVVAFVWFAAAAAVIGMLLRPDSLAVAGRLETAEAPASRRSAVAQLRLVLRDRSASSGLVAMVTATCVMVAVMTMTPLHLRDHGGSLELVGLVMSVHVAGMYAFAPLVGSLADRRGALPTAQAATAMLVGATVLGGSARPQPRGDRCRAHHARPRLEHGDHQRCRAVDRSGPVRGTSPHAGCHRHDDGHRRWCRRNDLGDGRRQRRLRNAQPHGSSALRSSPRRAARATSTPRATQHDANDDERDVGDVDAPDQTLADRHGRASSGRKAPFAGASQ